MLQAVELPYGNGCYQMTVLLPKAGKSISEVMKEMDADKLQKLSNDMDRCQVDLKFPKFTTEMDLSLNQIISKLGAPSISSQARQISAVLPMAASTYRRCCRRQRLR